jgi:hypothetical protein
MRLILLRALFINLILIHLSSRIGKTCLIPLIPNCPRIDLIVLLMLLRVEPVGLLLLLDVVLLLLLLIEHLLLHLLILILPLRGLLSIDCVSIEKLWLLLMKQLAHGSQVLMLLLMELLVVYLLLLLNKLTLLLLLTLEELHVLEFLRIQLVILEILHVMF